MKTMFKKTLVATAIVGLSANAFAAVDVVGSSTKVAYSTQALDAIATTFNVPGQNFQVELGAEYAVGDIITFTFSNDALASSQLATNITTSSVLNANGSPAANGAGKAAVTLGLLSSTATSATYRVTEVSTAATTVGQKFIIAKLGAAPATDPTTLALTASKVKAGNGFKITYAAQTSNGVVIDSSSTKSSFQLVHTADQFTVAAKPVFDAIIDVNADRKKFEGAVTTDSLTLTTTDKTGVDLDADGVVDVTWVPATGLVTYNKVAYTLKGDFTWIKDTDTDTPEIDAAVGTITVPAACSVESVKTDAIGIECTTAAAHVITLDTAQGVNVADPVVPVTSFTYDAKVTYATSKSATYASGLTAGAWTLNGSSVFVPYMVYGTLSGVNFSQVLTVANNSSKVGDIKVDVWAEDGKVLLSNVKVGEAKANSSTNIAGAVRTALEGAGLVNGKVSMKITTNVPGKAVTVYSAYTDVASRERAIVNNDSAVQTKGTALN